MNITSHYEGYCPQSNANQCIRIDFAEVSFIGQSTPEYKKMSFSCPNIDICEHLDYYGRCPLYAIAPNHP